MRSFFCVFGGMCLGNIIVTGFLVGKPMIGILGIIATICFVGYILTLYYEYKKQNH